MRWASHRITAPESQRSHSLLPHPTRARQVTDNPRFPPEPAALPQPPTLAGLTRDAVPMAGPSLAVGAGGGGPGAGPRARSPQRCRLARSSPAGLGPVPFQLEPAPRPAPALPASPRPPLLPFPFPPGPLPAKKSLFKLSSVRGRERAAEGLGSALGGHLGGAAPSENTARWRPGGPRDPDGRSRPPPRPQQGAGSPAPARWGPGNGAPPLAAPPRRRGHGVPAVMWKASWQGWPENIGTGPHSPLALSPSRGPPEPSRAHGSVGKGALSWGHTGILRPSSTLCVALTTGFHKAEGDGVNLE